MDLLCGQNMARQRSFVLEWKILMAKATITYLLVLMKVLGLLNFSLDFKRWKAKACLPSLIYSLTVALAGLTFYLYCNLLFHSNPALEYFFWGVTYYTVSMTNFLATVLVIAFYAVQLWNRQATIAYLNRVQLDYATFGLFYDSNLAFLRGDQYNERLMEEIDNVYVPIFQKVVLLNAAIVILLVLIAYFISLRFDFPAGHLIFYLAYPYYVQSVTSSFLHFGATKVSFMYKLINKKFQLMHDALKTTILDPKASHHDRMKLSCRFSDEIDEITRNVEKVYWIGVDLSTLYRVHMVFILSYMVFNSLYQLFFQYTGISYFVQGLCSYEWRAPVCSISMVFLAVLEILLVINTIENAVKGSRRVAKNVHRMLCSQQHFDERLKQSVSLV